MSDTIISPNMGLPVPVVSTEPGPDWATDINACMSVIDGHNHASGSGVQINPSGININSDLPFNSNNATSLRSARFTAQSAPLALSTDKGCLYESGVDLYYNDGSGNQVRITQGGSVTGSSGTITGLPSGTASASYSAGTFTFQGATSTPATMNIGPIITGRAIASPYTVTLTPSNGQGANYGMFWPSALPGSTSPMTVDASGNMGFGSTTGSGAFVQATSPTIVTPVITNPTVTTGTFASPNFTGAPSGTILGNIYAPTLTWNTSTPTVLEKYFFYTVIGVIVTVDGYISINTGGSSTSLNTITVPIIPPGAVIFSPAGSIVSTTVGASGSACSVAYGATSNLVYAVSPNATIGSGSIGIIAVHFTYRNQ